MKVDLRRVVLFALAAALVVTLSGCGASQAESPDSDGPASGTPAESADEASEPAETEVVGMPDGFPSDVPVHPGTVVEYDPMEVTDTTTVHQLKVESSASFDDVIKWYETSLPAGWSVGYLEDVDGEGIEAKIALDGGDYAPASPEGMGGGVLVGVDAGGEKTLIVTTVTVVE